MGQKQNNLQFDWSVAQFQNEQRTDWPEINPFVLIGLKLRSKSSRLPDWPESKRLCCDLSGMAPVFWR